MSSHECKCYLIAKDRVSGVRAAVSRCLVDDLPVGEVLIRVEYSSLNYKDALAATGHPGVARNFPHVPGIDAAGRVVQSDAPAFSSGDLVLVTGYELGAGQWGGWADFVRVPANWVVKLPPGLTPREAMSYGTAGLTAAMSVETLHHHHVQPDSGEIVVTGATGGVGMLAVMLLAKLGHSVVAVTGKPSQHDFLTKLGAARVVGREEVNDPTDKPLLSARWAGGVDTVGGNTLASLLRQTKNSGCVTACGLVGGSDLSLTVYPFLLRGVTLAGIDSAWFPLERRVVLWQKLAGPWKLPSLNTITTEIQLSQLPEYVEKILAGQNVGRVVVSLFDAIDRA